MPVALFFIPLLMKMACGAFIHNTARAASGGALAPQLPRATGVRLESSRIVGRCNPHFFHISRDPTSQTSDFEFDDVWSPYFSFLFFESDVCRRSISNQTSRPRHCFPPFLKSDLSLPWRRPALLRSDISSTETSDLRWDIESPISERRDVRSQKK